MKTSLPTPWSSSRRAVAAASIAALATLLGLAAWSAGDHGPGAAQASDSCSAADPGDGDYCSSSRCGPCEAGEGDCDPGQCGPGLTCVEEGSVDHCRPVDDGCDASWPGASDYCSSSRCGPCYEDEGDCDPGQCGSGLTCVEEGSVDTCHRAQGRGQLQVKKDGVWKNVCCVGGRPKVTSGSCDWTEYDRWLTDEDAGDQLDCPEGSPTDCRCDNSGERMHGYNGSAVDASIYASGGGPMYSDYSTETCVYVKSDGYLATKWTSSSCPKFQLD